MYSIHSNNTMEVKFTMSLIFVVFGCYIDSVEWNRWAKRNLFTCIMCTNVLPWHMTYAYAAVAVRCAWIKCQNCTRITPYRLTPQFYVFCPVRQFRSLSLSHILSSLSPALSLFPLFPSLSPHASSGSALHSKCISDERIIWGFRDMLSRAHFSLYITSNATELFARKPESRSRLITSELLQWNND